MGQYRSVITKLTLFLRQDCLYGLSSGLYLLRYVGLLKFPFSIFSVSGYVR